MFIILFFYIGLTDSIIKRILIKRSHLVVRFQCTTNTSQLVNKNTFLISVHPVDDLDGIVEAKAIRAGQGSDQLAGQLHRQSLIPLRERILKKTSIDKIIKHLFLLLSELTNL